jgi:very-short-patch-repair endonuclease
MIARPQPGMVCRARELREEMTDAERRLWSRLRARGAGRKFRRQVPIGRFVADFACVEAQLIVEIDGGQHAPAADASRTRVLESMGWRMLRFWNDEVLRNTEGVLLVIAAALKSPLPPGEGASGASG